MKQDYALIFIKLDGLIISRFKRIQDQELNGISLSILMLAINFMEPKNSHKFYLRRIELILAIENIQMFFNFFPLYLKLV